MNGYLLLQLVEDKLDNNIVVKAKDLCDALRYPRLDDFQVYFAHVHLRIRCIDKMFRYQKNGFWNIVAVKCGNSQKHSKSIQFLNYLQIHNIHVSIWVLFQIHVLIAKFLCQNSDLQKSINQCTLKLTKENNKGYNMDPIDHTEHILKDITGHVPLQF